MKIQDKKVFQTIENENNLLGYPLSEQERVCMTHVGNIFKVTVPACYLDLIDWNDLHDPLRKQVVPSEKELEWHVKELKDPIGDHMHSPVPRVVHRYPDRALLYPTLQCAITCRHCFRKESLNREGGAFSHEILAPALAYLASQKQICEVILSGGDPLMISDTDLAWLSSQLERISHLRLVRIHTRIPAVLPQRITLNMVNALKGRLMVCIVTHINHPREITPANKEACRILREAGFMLLNQSVLLKGINDDAETLATLFREVTYELGAKPYYLHHCDLARGLCHFRTSIETGLSLMDTVRGRLSGLCLPQYVLDLPEGHGKIPLGPSYVEGHEAYTWLFRNHLGERHEYEEIISKGLENIPER